MNVILKTTASRLALTTSLAVGFASACPAQGSLYAIQANRPAASPAQSALPASPATSAPQTYVISPGDALSVSVLDHDEFKADMTVLPDGTFNYPVVGKVHAAGLTVDQLTQKIVAGLGHVLDQPQVTVTVVQSHRNKVSVIGNAKSPGIYDIQPRWRVLDAIAASGGLVQAPELTQATLITDGGRQNTPIDLSTLMSGKDMTQNLPLSDGDILMLGAKAPDATLVQVTGEVQKPGQFAVPAEGASVLSLLTEAGGATQNAALSKAQILHAGQVRIVNLRQSTQSLDDPLSQERLEPGDVLLIPTNKARIAVMGEVKNPSVYTIPDGETLPVPMALSLAGGATDDGDKTKIQIIRRGADDKPIITTVDMRKYLSGEEHDVDLQAGDVLNVPTRHKGSSLNFGQLGGLAAIWKLLL